MVIIERVAQHSGFAGKDEITNASLIFRDNRQSGRQRFK